MAKTRPSKKPKSKKRDKNVLNSALGPSTPRSKPAEDPTALLAEATALLQMGQPDEAKNKAQRALKLQQKNSLDPLSTLPALNLVAEIYIELGNPDEARVHFLQAAQLDPDGALSEADGGGAEKFLWLAQLCEEGGLKSVSWFQKGVTALKKEFSDLEAAGLTGATLEEKKKKASSALCGMAEVYMTDLAYVHSEAHWRLRCNHGLQSKQLSKT
jgi:tetratricopeptide (TPR) repeat protein